MPFFIFDADNLVDEHYTAEMNKMLNAGYDVATCFRNSKNYDDSWISAGSGLWYVRESRYLNESRYLLGSGLRCFGNGLHGEQRISQKNRRLELFSFD